MAGAPILHTEDADTWEARSPQAVARPSRLCKGFLGYHGAQPIEFSESHLALAAARNLIMGTRSGPGHRCYFPHKSVA